MMQTTVKTLKNGVDWVLVESYIYECDDGRVVFVPAGFIFDYASIPRFFWRIFPPATGKHRVGALVHDWLCATERLTWVDSANIFLEVMKNSGVSAIKRYLIYCAVRCFGSFHKEDPRALRLRTLQDAELMLYGQKGKVFFRNVI